jgi:hypothetical protein
MDLLIALRNARYPQSHPRILGDHVDFDLAFRQAAMYVIDVVSVSVSSVSGAAQRQGTGDRRTDGYPRYSQ